MKTITLFLAVALVLTSCNSQSSKSQSQNKQVSYDSYFNRHFDYQLDYPDFLIPQGESDNGDGQKFISSDGESKLLVYNDIKMDLDTGDDLSIEQAFAEDQQGKKVTEKQLYDNYYSISGEQGDDKLFSQYTFFEMGSYTTMLFEYPKEDKTLFDNIIKHVTESFSVGVNEGSFVEIDDEFFTFLDNFLQDCYWDNNLYDLLLKNTPAIAKYIDPKMDVIRYYNPGAIALLYRRADNFGFDEYNDLKFKPEIYGEYAIIPVHEGQSCCELDLDANENSLYFEQAEALPDEMINPETFDTKPVTIPYPNAKIINLYLRAPDKFGNIMGLYFVKTPNGWKLAAIDNSLCSA